MADGKEVAVVETSTANPKQAVNVIDNIENVSAFNTPTQTLQENPAIFKQQENNSFFNSDAWNTFKSNPMRAFEPKYPGFAAIESVASNPVYTSTVDRYGEAVANRAQVLHSTYAKATNPFSRFAEAYNTHRYGLRAAAARKELSDAIRDGDEAKVSTAKLKYQSERRKSYEEGYGYEEYGDTLMSVLASMARNPETIAIEIGGAVAAPFTGGASMLAANAINAGIVGLDTYKVEAGGALEQLDEISPELSEEQKMGHARNVGWLNAAVEAGMFGMGGNVLGRGVKGIGTEAAIKSTVRAVKKETGKEITRDAAKELLKVRFLKALQNPAKEKTFKDTLKEVAKDIGWGALGEGGQEVFQNSVTESMLRSVKNGTTLTEEMLDDWVDFVTNPFSETHADKWETFVNVSLASLIPGAGFQGVAGAIRGYKGNGGQAELNDVQSKLLGARNNSLGLSQLFSWHKNAGSKDAIGVSNAVLEDQIKRGEVSGKLYTTAEQVAEMQKDPEVAAALEEIGIAKALEQAAENGGVVELDLVAYDKVVNESQNTALFQKMRNYLSFSDTTMSLNEFNQFINSKGKQLASLITDEIRNDQESVYNKLKAMALKAGRPEERAEGYAVLGHLILTNMEGLVNGQKNDILDRLTLKVSTDNETLVERFNKEKAEGNTQTGAAKTLSQKIMYKGQKKDMYNDVYTADGIQVKYAEYDNKHNTGYNRDAILDKSNVKVVKLSPAQFLAMAAPKMGYTDVSELENAIKGGQEIAMPFLNVKVLDAANKLLKVEGHEGRHRSLAMKNLGVENGYAILDSKDFYKTPELFKDGLKGWKLVPEKETDISKAINLDEDARESNSADVDIAGMVDAVFTEKEESNSKTYHMVVYAGSRVDYDKPSLEAIGTGEGNQAHGWGLYYALNPDIAERYREMFTGDAALKYDEEKLNDLYTKLERSGDYEKASVLESVLLRHDERDFDSMLEDGVVSKEAIDWFDSIKEDYLNKERKLGQVHEVDIPEVDLLLDEQKTFSEQPQAVKDALTKPKTKIFKASDREKGMKFFQEKLEENKSSLNYRRFDPDVEVNENGDYVVSYYDLLVPVNDDWTGSQIYSYIAKQLGSDKAASKELEKYGIKGITYDGRDDGRCFVIFNDKDVKVLRKKFDELGRQLFMFTGEKANTSALPQAFQDRIQKAKDMMAQGKSDKEVFEETRLHIAPDGKLRIQISDKDAQLTEDSGKFLRQYKDKYGKSRYRKEQCKLGDIFEHELLFDLYPALKDLPVYISGTSTYASGMGRYINLSTTETPSRVRQSILHEVQHIIQKYEGFARGGQNKPLNTKNTDFRKRQDLISGVAKKLVENKVITYWAASEGGDTASDMYNSLSSADEMRALIDSPAVKKIATKDAEFAKDIEEIRRLNDVLEGLDNRLAYFKYFRLFGEAESRLTERLSYKSQEELDKLDPYGYFDVSRFIVKDQNDVVIAEVEAPKNTQDTGEFNVVFDAETGRSIVDGTLVVAGKTIEQNGRYTIQLEPEANAVTFAHELFHVLSLEIQRVYNEGTITEYWKKQAEKMFKIAGAEAQVDETDPTVERYYLTEAQEEHLANMFTTYIMKGKIQNREVRGLLAKLIDIFKATYQQLEGAGLTPMALDKKANEFFDAVISSQNTIEEIQRDAGLLEILPPEGVDRELYDYYIDNLTTSKIEASNDLRRKWFAIDGFKKSAEYTKLMQRLKEEAKAELLEDDRYKIIAQASLFEGKDKAEQVFIWAQNNMPEANYTLGDITDILENTPSLEEASTKAAEQEMEAYIVKKFRITPQDLGFKEERNRAKVRALLAESVMRRGGTLADMETEIKKAEAASDKHIANISVYQIIDLNKWKNREAAIVERYAWARQQDNKDLMSAERYNQAVVNLIMIKANGYKSEYQKLNALFEKLQAKQKKYQRKDEHGNPYGPYEHRYHAEDWELLRSISEKFGNNIRDGRRSVKNVHEQLVDWIKTQVENRFTTVAGLEDFLPFIDKGHDGKIGSMKGKNFKKLWAVMHTIDSVAMREQQLYLDGQYQQLGEFVDETVKFHREKQIKTDEDKDSWYSKFFGRYGTWQNPEPLLKAIFPPKVFQKIFLPMFEGALKSEYIAKRWIKEWNDAKAKINTSNEAFVLDDGSQITYGETVKKTMTYGDVANLLIAMGAEHSYENYRLKFGLSEEQVQVIASQAIKRNAAYVDFMNTTWKVYGEATEALNDSFQERTNELFVRKEHRAFEVDGIKFEGGYVPEDKHYVALVRELGTWNQGLKNKKENKNEKLLAKAADGDILSIIDITETKLSQSAKWAYAAVPYNNVKKFIEQKAVSDTIGDRAFNFIKDWLQGWDTPHFDESGIWRPLTRVTTVAALGARASTVLLQLSGIMQAMTYLGPTYLARGMLQFVRENGFFHPFKTPRDKSIYMETRVEDPFSARFGTESQGRSFKDILNSYNAKSKVGKAALGVVSAYQTAAMVSIQIVDGWVSTITWNGAYARALDKGMTEAEARAEADSAVRTTQSDATQISRSAAMQEPWARAVTAFSTWIMAMRSQVVALSTSKSYRKDMAMWIVSYAVMSSFIEAFLKEVTKPADEGEEDKEMLERIFNSWYNKIVEAVGSQAMPFAGFGSSAAKIAAAALVNTDDEKIFNVYAGGNVAALQYGWRVAQAGGQALKYMRTGEDEDLEKLGIQATGLVSYGLKKRVKKALED